MKQMNTSAVLLDKLVELNELEITKLKVLTVIFKKTTKDIMIKKVQLLKDNFIQQAQFYNQNFEDYEDVYKKIISKFKEQLSQIIDKYNQLFINMQLELQEAECNQKIAITNLKKSFDMKQKLSNDSQGDLLKEYTKKISACIQKKTNYDTLIDACEKELDEYASFVENKMNMLFSDKLSQISLKEKGIFTKIINKIKNIFLGATKFNTYVVEPMNIELEMIDNKLPDILNDIHQETICFVAKMRQAKEEINQIFENMI